MKMFIGECGEDNTRYLIYCKSKEEIGEQLIVCYTNAFKYQGITIVPVITRTIRKRVEHIMTKFKWYEVVTPFGIIIDGSAADAMLSVSSSEILQEAIEYSIMGDNNNGTNSTTNTNK